VTDYHAAVEDEKERRPATPQGRSQPAEPHSRARSACAGPTADYRVVSRRKRVSAVRCGMRDGSGHDEKKLRFGGVGVSSHSISRSLGLPGRVSPTGMIDRQSAAADGIAQLCGKGRATLLGISNAAAEGNHAVE